MSYAYDLHRDLPNPPEHVWRALTEADLLSRWFMVCDQDLTTLPIGGRFTLTDADAKGWSGILDGELLERSAPSRLVYRTDERDGTSSTTLTWTLAATELGTRLHLHHAGWEGVAWVPDGPVPAHGVALADREGPRRRAPGHRRRRVVIDALGRWPTHLSGPGVVARTGVVAEQVSGPRLLTTPGPGAPCGSRVRRRPAL